MFPALGPYAYTVAANPGVSVLSARASIAGAVLQDFNKSPVNIDKVTRRGSVHAVDHDRQGRLQDRPAPRPKTVIYTFYVRNGSDRGSPGDDRAVEREGHRRQVRQSGLLAGDTNGNGKLETNGDVGLHVHVTHPAPGTYHNVAVANGDNILYGRPVPRRQPA